MPGAIQVINPNSSPDVTTRMADALADVVALSPWPVRYHTLADGPPGIETQAQVDGATAPLMTLAAKLEPETVGYVIACFSDPGVSALREWTTKPVIGIAEAAILGALGLGGRFGIIAIKAGSIRRHLHLLGALGLRDHLAGDLSIDRGVTELADDVATFARLTDVGLRLRDEFGAQSIIMGCVGFSAYRRRLEDLLDLPVIDPTPIALGQMVMRLTLDHQDTRQRALIATQ